MSGVPRSTTTSPDKEALLLGFITHETEQYAAVLQSSLDDLDDPPVERLRTYVSQQIQLKRIYHVAPPAPPSCAACSPARRSSACASTS